MPAPNSSGYSEESKPAEEVKPAEGEPNLDEFGYEEEAKPAEEVKPEAKPAEEEPVKNPVTGYGEDTEEEVKPDGEKAPEGLKEEMTKLLGELPEGYNKEITSKFVLENNMTKEQTEAYVKFAKEESQQLKIDQDAQLKATRKQWKEELINDPTFGGEFFDKNVDRVWKTFEKHMPNMKKVLTDKGGMLPPYIMRDLLGISKLLNPTTNLVNGSPSEVISKETNFLEDMYE